MERYSLRTNITSQLTNFLKLTTIVNLNQNNYTNSTVGGDVGNLRDQGAGALFGAIFYPSYLPVYDAEGQYNVFSRTPNPVSMQDINDKSEQNGYYMNFSLAETPMRLRSINTQKVLGASTFSLRMYLLLESVLGCVCGFLL